MSVDIKNVYSNELNDFTTSNIIFYDLAYIGPTYCARLTIVGHVQLIIGYVCVLSSPCRIA